MSYRTGRPKLELITDVCKRCNNPITDRKRLGFRILSYCNKCKIEKRLEYLRKHYRDTHPKKITKRNKLLSLLEQRPRIEPELLRLTKIKNTIALKTTITRLRIEGHNVVAIHFMPSHYVLVKP